MIGRHESEKKLVTDVPGPGKYSPSTKCIEVSVTSPISFGAFTSAGPKQGQSSKVLSPGPGNYNVNPKIMEKKGGIVFGTEQRPGVEIKAQIKNPGPGAYNSLKNPGKPQVAHCITYYLQNYKYDYLLDFPSLLENN